MRFAIIGFGEYARKVHAANIKQHGELAVIIDFEQVLEEARELQPQAQLISASTHSSAEVAQLIAKCNVDACIVSTPPQARKQYLLALINKNIAIFCDKPLTYPKDATEEINQARKILGDYEQIRQAAKQQQCVVWIHAQRRHDKVLEIIKQEATKTLQALHYLEITKSDGQERTAQEMDLELPHGYIGEGIMAHSGYHYIDLVAQISQLVDHDRIEVDTQAYTCNEHAGNVEKASGELDAHIRIKFKQESKVVLIANLAIRHTGVSARNTNEKITNWTDGSGRIKQERLIATFGTDICINYSREFAPSQTGRQHLASSCKIMRNPSRHKKEYEEIRLASKDGKKYQSYREQDFNAFITYVQNKAEGINSLESHQKSIKIYAAVCESLARNRCKLASNISIK